MINRHIAVIICLLLLTGCATHNIKQGADAYARGDFDEAAKHWIPHAKEGNAYAQYNVGILWEQGLGRTPLNTNEASNWYFLSAKQGYIPAMVRLANLQRSGGHEEAAQSWLVLAARWGDSSASTALRTWGKEVPPADLLAQQQYNKAVADQQVSDALALTLSYFLIGFTSYNQAYSARPLPYQAYSPPAQTYKPPVQTYQTVTQIDSGCTSDFSCGSGHICVKAPFKSSGACMKTVDAFNLPVYNSPRPGSININTHGQCQFNTDCPIGFKCDDNYKACVKR